MNEDDNDAPRPVELIFSCQVCYTPISEIYRDAEYDKGFRDKNGSFSEQPITKLWLADCCHLVCGRHLEGGGVPFHPPGHSPEVSCPVCISEKGDHKKRRLFGIRGCLPGQYDKEIPESYFNTPPIRLDSSGKGMDALRFHYLALARFATHMFCRMNDEKCLREKLENEHRRTLQERADFETTVELQKGRIRDLEQSEHSLKHWKEREPRIMYYLGVFKEAMEENTSLRNRLGSLGLEVPPRKYEFQIGTDGRIPNPPEDVLNINRRQLPRERREDGDWKQQGQQHWTQQDTASSRTFSGRATRTLDNLQVMQDGAGLAAEPSRKSKKDNTPNERVPCKRPARSPRSDSADSRVLMPPPPRPSEAQKLNVVDRSKEALPRKKGSDELMQDPPLKLDVTQAPRPGGIFLRDDGTWERILERPRKRQEPCHAHAQTSLNSWRACEKNHLPDEDNHYIGEHAERREHTHNQHHDEYWARGCDDTQRNEKSVFKDKAQQENPFEQRSPLQVDSEQPFILRSQHDQAQSEQQQEHNNSPYKYRNDTYQRPPRCNRVPLEMASTATLNRRGAFDQSNPQWPLQGGNRFGHYCYDDQEKLKDAHATYFNDVAYVNSQHFTSHVPKHTPYNQTPRTPSPRKRHFQQSTSVASPFFRNSAMRERTGRLTFPERKPANPTPNGLVTPQRSVQEPRSRNHIDQPSVYKNLFTNFMSRKPSDKSQPLPHSAAKVRNASYFDNQGQGQTPIRPRPNIFATGTGVEHTPKRLMTQDFAMQDHSNRGFDLGRSGPSRMSLEGRRQNRAALGDYLRAHGEDVPVESTMFGGGNRRLARR